MCVSQSTLKHLNSLQLQISKNSNKFIYTRLIKFMRQLLNTILKSQKIQLLQNRKFLLKRQSEQLQLLENRKNKIDNRLLDKNISELVKINKQEVFNTFACRTLNPKFKQLNSLADVNIERALTRNPTGVPFTVKDHLKVDGMIETCGFSKNISPSLESAEVVQLLEKQGCIAYAHSNVPQGLLGIQSSNPVYGPTKNPYNPKFIAGGSSGGQGPQVAARACAFSLCSDSAGSVRIPAAFCGVYGFKPTGSKRLCVKGRVGVNGRQGPGVPGLDTSFGYLTRNVEDLEWLCQKTLGKSINYNPNIFGKWNKELYEKSKSSKKRFGLISSTHQIDLAPAVINVLNETVELLRNQGHEVVQFNFPYLHKFRNFFFKVLNNVGFINAMRTMAEGEFPAPQNVTMLNKFNGTYLGRKLKVYMAQSELEKQKFSLYDIGNSTAELMILLKDRDFWQQEFNKQWERSQVDLLISPTMPFTAPYHGQTQNSIHQLTFTAFQNVLELPAGHVPVRLVRQNETQYEDTRLYGAEVRRAIQKSEGLPVGVQISGAFMKDEVVIGAMWQLQQAMGRKFTFPALD